MSVYPFDIDDDSTIARVDDNITEIGGDVINSLRDAMFAVQKELGVNPSGSVSSVATRLDKSLTADGDIKASALASVGLATLPIDDAQVGTNAGIKEFKLDLDFSTSDLNTLIQANSTLLNSVNSFLSEVGSNLGTHIAGGAVLIDGSPGRHVASHIDLNAVPTDTRDAPYTWTGLLDKDGNPRAATHVASALLEVNNAFTGHENSTSGAHNASAVDIDVDNFLVIPSDIDDVQKFAEYVDNVEVLELGDHRATQHEDSVVRIARSENVSIDGYGHQNVVPPTLCQTYLVRAPNTMPVDDISTGDDVISFTPTNTGFIFDSQFSKVQNGDVLRVNYANGMEAVFYVESTKFIPGSTWIVRINGTNLADSDGYALARIDRPNADRNTSGVCAVAAANATPVGSFDTILSSVIVGHPRGATALGLDFDPGQLDATHYNLYLELYPTGNPSDRVISLPAIDVTGDAGTSPGQYTLESVVQSTNDQLREIGFNLRLIAFAHEGEFGIMMADAINNASFAILKGVNSVGALIVGGLTDNVIGEDREDTFDALGFGASRADIAGVSFISRFEDENDAAGLNTVIIPPAKKRNYFVNGRRRDSFASTWMANQNGYWDGYISARVEVGAFTVETTYTIFLDLEAAGLKPGMTLVVQPVIPFTDALYFDVDYGRFIIKNINFIPACPGDPPKTLITVINGLHAEGAGFGFSSSPNLAVRLYFSEDSVSFNEQNVIDTSPTALDYRRHHEIFVTDEGKTFSHERARMPVQQEDIPTTRFLSTARWHIESVSSKLRGYRDSATTYNKFIRFYLLSYNADTGEYDGYIGQRVPSTGNITKVGPRTTGRKNVPTKFYDETNIDFIELTFDETSTSSPGFSILSDATSPAPAPEGDGTPRYVDIELFDSLINQDEVFFLATCEVNWDPNPPAATQIVQRVVDRRQFGSIGSEEFTQDAIDFVTAGDRFLHDNGVLRGLDFDLINPSDNREIFYKGGFAFVNGRVVPVNATSVTIPEIHEDGTPPPPDRLIDWAVCVNEAGTLEPILITASKQQFFAKDNNSTNVYYVPSVTFAELVETRKDLTPIAVVTATIASITITSDDVLDVRRFIDDGKKRELVYSPDDFVGTFHTEDALKNWVNQYGSSNPLVVKVRGTFDVSSSIDLTGFTNKVILDGDGALFNVTALKGLLVDNNITIRNISFNYNPTAPGGGYTTDDKINSANGCIYQGSGTNIQGVTIENCTFTSALTTQRPPFISFEREGTDAIEELNIINNRFNDANVNPAEDQAAIAIMSLNTTGATPAIVINSRIEENICNNHQGIYLTVETNVSTEVVAPGINAINVSISRNSCGIIGFLTTAKESAYTLDTRTDRTQGLIIEGNAANIIASVVNMTLPATTGTQIASQSLGVATTISIGATSIVNNSCHWILVTNGQDESASEFGQMIITGNRLTAFDATFLNQWSPLGAAPNIGIFHQRIVTSGFGDLADQIDDAVISHNILTAGLFDTITYFYSKGIETEQSATIQGNIVKGMIVTTGIGIEADIVGANGTFFVTIQDNKIYRDSTTDIARYIELDSLSKGNGIVTGNFFDDITIDGASYSFGVNDPINTNRNDGWVVYGNKNQTEVIELSEHGWISMIGSANDSIIVRDGVSTIESAAAVSPSVTETLLVGASQEAVTFLFDQSDSVMDLRWNVNLNGVLPIGVQIIDAEIDCQADVADGGAPDTVQIVLAENTTSVAAPTAVSIPETPTVTTTKLTDDVSYTAPSVNIPSNRLRLGIIAHGAGVAATVRRISLSSIRLTYRW